MKPKTIIILILIILAIVILIQNTQVVEVQVFFWKVATVSYTHLTLPTSDLV